MTGEGERKLKVSVWGKAHEITLIAPPNPCGLLSATTWANGSRSKVKPRARPSRAGLRPRGPGANRKATVSDDDLGFKVEGPGRA